MANSTDPDETAPGAVWSGSTVFVQTCLYNLESSHNASQRLIPCAFWVLTKHQKVRAPKINSGKR